MANSLESEKYMLKRIFEEVIPSDFRFLAETIQSTSKATVKSDRATKIAFFCLSLTKTVD